MRDATRLTRRAPDEGVRVRRVRTSDVQRIKGWFYLPSTEELRVPGVLTWTQDAGAELELFGGLLPSEPLAGLENPETVRGSDVSQTIFCETTTGEFVSLWEADRGNYRGNAGAVQEEH